MSEGEVLTRPVIPKEEIQKKLLHILCSNSGECITFGRFEELLNQYFEYLDFKYLTSPITRIGIPSVNGFINELVFQKEEYKIYTILKSTTRQEADNLAYEFLVGKMFINYFASSLPCFVKTYKCLHYENIEIYNTLLENKTNDASVLQTDGIREITTLDELYDISCRQPKEIAVLIQHIENPISLFEFLVNNKDEYTTTIDLLQILLQIYLPLGKLMKIFSHNDLHLDNILLYQIPNNQYVEMTYQLENTREITFKTKYIVKFIDYGRCYFDNILHPGFNSRNIFQNLLKNPHCNSIWKKRRNLGYVGYGWLSREADQGNQFSSALTGNKAKDLWAVLMIYGHLKDPDVYKDVPIMNDLITIISRIEGNRKSGGLNPEHESVLCTPENKKICNVAMFAMQLIGCYIKNSVSFHEEQSRYFAGNTSLGKIRVYMDLKKNIDFQLTGYHHIPSAGEEDVPPPPPPPAESSPWSSEDIPSSAPMHTEIDIGETMTAGKRSSYKRKKTHKTKTTKNKKKTKSRKSSKRK
jgi:hypothetical protein